jgi:Ala-tRNA(Pro) deacylase
MTDTALLTELERARASYEVLPHERTESAAQEARMLGMPLDAVAKTIVVETRTGAVRAVIPADERLDIRKLRTVLGSHGKLRLASEGELEEDYPEFELGSVPPVGGEHRDPVVVDRRLTEHGHVVLEAGVHDESVRVRTADLLLVARALVADICDER